METLPLAMALFSGLARIDAHLLHDRPSSCAGGFAPLPRRRIGQRLLRPAAFVVVPLALGFALAFAT